MNSDLLSELLADFKPVTEWHRDMGQTFEEYAAQILDEMVGWLHWPVTP